MNEQTPLLVLRSLPVRVRLGTGIGRLGDFYVFNTYVYVVLRAPVESASGKRDRYFQSRGRVQINECLLPPWYNTVLLLTPDDGGVVALAMPGWNRSRLKKALRQPGLEVHVARRSYFNLFQP
jgi:hypothetical protein